MDTENAIRESIREAPTDLDQRRVYADWLDDRMDPRGEFIRLQIQSDEVEDLYASENETLRLRHDHLLRENETNWLGACGSIKKTAPNFSVEFRGGMVERVFISCKAYREHAAAIKESFPALQELGLYGVNRNTKMLDSIEELRSIPKVRICDWITPDDAYGLRRPLEAVRELAFWTGHIDDFTVGQMFAESLPSLQKLRPVRLTSGNPQVQNHTLRLASMKAELDQAAGHEVCEFEKPFQRKFPLAGEVGHGCFAGTFSDGRLGVVVQNYPGFQDQGIGVLVFSEEGEYEETLLHPEFEGVVLEERSWEELDDLEETLLDEYGFELGRVHVKQFECGTTSLSVMVFPIDNPAELDFPADDEKLHFCHSVQRDYVDGGHFAIKLRRNAYHMNMIHIADRSGKIRHTG